MAASSFCFFFQSSQDMRSVVSASSLHGGQQSVVELHCCINISSVTLNTVDKGVAPGSVPLGGVKRDIHPIATGQVWSIAIPSTMPGPLCRLVLLVLAHEASLWRPNVARPRRLPAISGLQPRHMKHSVQLAKPKSELLTDTGTQQTLKCNSTALMRSAAICCC